MHIIDRQRFLVSIFHIRKPFSLFCLLQNRALSHSEVAFFILLSTKSLSLTIDIHICHASYFQNDYWFHLQPHSSLQSKCVTSFRYLTNNFIIVNVRITSSYIVPSVLAYDIYRFIWFISRFCWSGFFANAFFPNSPFLIFHFFCRRLELFSYLLNHYSSVHSSQHLLYHSVWDYLYCPLYSYRSTINWDELVLIVNGFSILKWTGEGSCTKDISFAVFRQL